MSPKALGLSEVKEDLFLYTFGFWVGEPGSAEVGELLVDQSCPGLQQLLLGQGLWWLPGEGGGVPTILLGFSVPPSRGLTALVLYWAGTGPPKPRSLSALSLETQKRVNTGSWTAQSQAGHGRGGKRPRKHVGLVQARTDKPATVTISEVENMGLSEQEKAPASWLRGTPRGEATCPN